MLDNKLDIYTMKYIDKLKIEINMLRQENAKLRKTFLSDVKNENISLLQANMQIDMLKRELAKEKHKNAMLVLMR